LKDIYVSLPPHVLAVIRATETSADYLPSSKFKSSDIRSLIRNAKTAHKLHAGVMKSNKLSISVHCRTTYREFLYILSTVYCRYSLLLILGVGTVSCPAKLFHLYGKILAETENLLEDFDVSELRKKT
jgi:hypothetical protein